MVPLFLLGLSLVGGAAAYVSPIMKPLFALTMDPIVTPDSYTESHLHHFFGSDGVTAHTKSSDELRKGCTSADNYCDLSSYWIPALINKHTGEEIVPVVFAAYYFNIGFAEMSIPDDLKLIAGNSKAQTRSEIKPDESGHRIFCRGDTNGDEFINKWPDHPCPKLLHMLLYFPDCIDPDDLSKHAYSKGAIYSKPGPCPGGMKRIAQIRFSVRYDTKSLVPSKDLMFSSGNFYSWHGDFFMGWDREAAEDMMKAKGEIYQRLAAKYEPKCPSRPKKQCTPHNRNGNQGMSTYGAPRVPASNATV